MPIAPPRLCSCGRIVPSGQRCACSITRKWNSDRRRPNARQRGYTTEWDKARAVFLAIHRHCALCGTLALVVDHITPHRGDMGLFWDRTNWQALCAPCHNSTKQLQERLRERY
jgi:5-methylcytosine-specific restriction enzyme A